MSTRRSSRTLARCRWMDFTAFRRGRRRCTTSFSRTTPSSRPSSGPTARRSAWWTLLLTRRWTWRSLRTSFSTCASRPRATPSSRWARPLQSQTSRARGLPGRPPTRSYNFTSSSPSCAASPSRRSTRRLGSSWRAMARCTTSPRCRRRSSRCSTRRCCPTRTARRTLPPSSVMCSRCRRCRPCWQSTGGGCRIGSARSRLTRWCRLISSGSCSLSSCSRS
mmetsp:Transcript_77748/g.154469  ORF Transcript_77748/g.154469 Transcript_77748/m.154469 type:complete len:221 (-) Transcript_77748:1804-2466(-)